MTAILQTTSSLYPQIKMFEFEHQASIPSTENISMLRFKSSSSILMKMSPSGTISNISLTLMITVMLMMMIVDKQKKTLKPLLMKCIKSMKTPLESHFLEFPCFLHQIKKKQIVCIQEKHSFERWNLRSY